MANNFLNLTDTQLEAYSTLAIAGLTLVYVLVGVFQWWAMRAALKVTQASNKNTARSIEIAEQGMELQHRAWLWVTKVETATISLEVEPSQ